MYVDKYLSLFGFRKGYSTQHCLSVMINKWKKAMDSGKLAGELLTDLSKAFDCLNNHELLIEFDKHYSPLTADAQPSLYLIAKLEAYGFHNSSLRYIVISQAGSKELRSTLPLVTGVTSYLEFLSQYWVPYYQYIYINDIFYFINMSDIAN